MTTASREQVEAALRSLPRPQRLVLILCVHEGLTVSETAAALGMPASHALEMYRSALAYCRKCGLLSESNPPKFAP